MHDKNWLKKSCLKNVIKIYILFKKIELGKLCFYQFNSVKTEIVRCFENY